MIFTFLRSFISKFCLKLMRNKLLHFTASADRRDNTVFCSNQQGIFSTLCRSHVESLEAEEAIRDFELRTNGEASSCGSQTSPFNLPLICGTVR